MPIANPQALLTELLKQPTETSWLEFKKNLVDPEQVGRTVSACANAAMLEDRERAYIAFGIEDATRKRVGTTTSLHDKKVGGENFENWINRMVEPRIVLELVDFEVAGKAFAVIAITPGYDRPVRFAGDEYIRIGENVRKLRDHPEHERALWLATSRHKFEGAVALSHQSASDVLQLLDVDAYFNLLGEPRAKSDDETLRKLITAEMIRPDMEGGYDITNLGAILLAQDIAQFSSIASKSVRVIKYAGRDKRKTEKETEGKRGYASGFRGLLSYVTSALPTEERYIEGVRRNVSTYPMTAIREIIANALIHQDFTLPGAGPVIEIYEDRVEVTNPGNSLIQVDRMIDERRSRNEKLAQTMRALGICEERGGGLDKAILEVEDMSLPAPKFHASTDSMRVVVFGPREFSQLSKEDRIWACFCHCVIRWLQHDYMSNTTLRERFRLPAEEYQAASAVISEARKAKRIVPADEKQGRRNARYVPYWAR